MSIRPRLAVLLVALAAVVLPAHAGAATFTPTTTADGVNGSCGPPGPCTLRDAFDAAMASPGNVVSIPAGRYVITLGELNGDEPITIDGDTARNTIIDA